jgi:hypothetical protein
MAIGLLVGCGRQPDSSVLATVDGDPVTREVFRRRWAQNPPVADTAEARSRLLEQLVQRRAVVRRAIEAGLDRDPEVVEAIESLLIARLKETELHPRIAAVEVSEAELRAAYERDKAARYTLPARVRPAVLWYDTREQAPLVERYRPRLEEVRNALLGDPQSLPPEEGFGRWAVRNTEHRASRYKGGDLGWMESVGGLDSWRNAVIEISNQLESPGAVSPVIERPEGLFLVRLIGRQAARVQAFAAVQGAIERQLRTARQLAEEARFAEETRRRVVVKRFPARLLAVDGLAVRAATANPGDAVPMAVLNRHTFDGLQNQ